MNIELILWIVAFFVVWEGIYIYSLKRDKKSDYSWGIYKFMSGVYSLLFIFIQIMVVGDYNTQNTMFPFHYERLIWEFGIILALFVFFKINKKLYDWIERR